MSHGAGRVIFRDLHEFFFRFLVPEGMQQRDAAFECLLRRCSTGNREVHGPQLLRGQIFVVMISSASASTPNSDTTASSRAARFMGNSIASESRPVMMEGSIQWENKHARHLLISSLRRQRCYQLSPCR